MRLSLTREQDFPFCVRVAFRTLRPAARTLSVHGLGHLMRLSPRPPNTLLEWYNSNSTVPLTHTPRGPPGVGGFERPAATAADPEKEEEGPTTQMLPARETCGGDMNGVGFNPFEDMFFFKKKTSSCVRTQTLLVSVAASRVEFSKTCERRDARNRSKA